MASGDQTGRCEPMPGMHILSQPGHAVRIADPRFDIQSLSISATVSLSPVAETRTRRLRPAPPSASHNE
ncbi:hypothetical protein CBOM_01893 [Ceraceosorus bombacis]|uniref:Uncharacterized protein n=1 Tax=Ceraceosorus bombacis TaxID=401625 RepID=A0A0P1BDU9_9BASI|nr:hypothetical protein CBOM_01893 [Ceraceosorus bombacis]